MKTTSLLIHNLFSVRKLQGRSILSKTKMKSSIQSQSKNKVLFSQCLQTIWKFGPSTQPTWERRSIKVTKICSAFFQSLNCHPRNLHKIKQRAQAINPFKKPVTMKLVKAQFFFLVARKLIIGSQNLFISPSHHRYYLGIYWKNQSRLSKNKSQKRKKKEAK